MTFVIGIVVLIVSVILHEVAHGFVADRLGDPTARYAGRLTLNPIPHIDPMGSVMIPLFLALSHSPFLFGWAKPVPYNPYNLRGGKWAEAAVAAAGPATNLLIAVAFGLALRFFIGVMPDVLIAVSASAVLSNLSLAVLNLIPLPPIDGSKVLRALLPRAADDFYSRLEGLSYSVGPIGLIIVLLIIVNFFQAPMSALVGSLFSLVTGLR